MNILIIGASSKNSIGYIVGEKLKIHHEHSVVYTSRNGKLGLKCDVTHPRNVRRILLKTKPGVVVLAAGVFTAPKILGSIRSWSRITEHILAKSLGPLVLANAFTSLKTKRVRYFIALGGRAVSSESGFAAYTVGNGALWSLTNFLNRHSLGKAFYIDLPFVKDSRMEKQYYRATKSRAQGISIETNEVVKVVERILRGEEKRARIILGGKGSA